MNTLNNPNEHCNYRDGKPAALVVRRWGNTRHQVTAYRCADHARGLRAEAIKNTDGSYEILRDDALPAIRARKARELAAIDRVLEGGGV